MDIINLNEADVEIIKQYVEIRNKYIRELNSKPVNLKETIEWLKNANVIIRGAIISGELLAVTIIYPEKNNEVCGFMKTPGLGIAYKCYLDMLDMAKKNDLPNLTMKIRIDNDRMLKFAEKLEWTFSGKRGEFLHFIKYFNRE